MTFTSGQILELDVETLAFGGQGIAKYDGFTIFIDRAIPGQKVKAELTEVKKSFAHAKRIEIIEHAEIETKPFCNYFEECGGCMHQDIEYDAQTYWKGRQVRETMTRIGKISPEVAATIEKAVPSPLTNAYRNKMEFFISGSGDNLIVGLKKRGSESEVINIAFCPLMESGYENILSTVKTFCSESGIPSFDSSKNGYWRRLVIRKSRATGEHLVHLITGPGKRFHSEAEKLGSLLIKEEKVAAFVHSTRKGKSDIAEGEWIVGVQGNDHITETLNRPDGSTVEYAITPNAFFQTNTAGAEILFATVGDQLKLDKSETVIDLFCGSGGIGIFLADKLKSVFGVELSEEAVLMAADNAKTNAIGNCIFKARNLDKVKSPLAGIPDSDILVMDPPRRGVNKNTLLGVADTGVQKIIYVSCNPATLARDAALLKDKYDVVRVIPVDMFPHTHHVECVCVMEKKI